MKDQDDDKLFTRATYSPAGRVVAGNLLLLALFALTSPWLFAGDNSYGNNHMISDAFFLGYQAIANAAAALICPWTRWRRYTPGFLLSVFLMPLIGLGICALKANFR